MYMTTGQIMELLEQTQIDQITITESAAKAVQELINTRNLPGYTLRVYISGGGCSGFQYGMALEGNVRDSDLVFEDFGVKVIVDEISINYLHGATIDYVDELMGSGFKINNPNAVATCGCGQSYRTAGDTQDTTSASSSCCGCQ
jgi:iron-sulfur cluster assembly protein